MEKFNIFFRINGKNYCENVFSGLSISGLYDVVEKKILTNIRETHIIKINGKILQDNTFLNDYNVTPDSTFDIQYSLSKAESFRKPDIEGELIFKKLLDKIAYESGKNDVNVVSLMSYNVDNYSNTNKLFLQQLQWPTIKKQLKRLDVNVCNLDDIVNVNIILPDRNFIGYNNMFNPNYNENKEFNELIECLASSSLISDTDLESVIRLYNESSNIKTPQIDEICKIKENKAFNNNAHEYNYRIRKYSIMLENFSLNKIFEVSQSLKKIIQLNFYYVGIIFENIEYNDPKNFIAYGIDFSPLQFYNLHVHVWTGYKII